jgi:hypothetical protein
MYLPDPRQKQEVFVYDFVVFVCFQMSTVRFGQLGESPSLLVVSNQRLYFLEMSSSTQ